jgi:hypothetical protein
MKKNVMMRLACFLLVAVLISTSAISGTYAKYVTEGSSKDTARVAAFGVQVLAEFDQLFKEKYETTTAWTGDDSVSVKSIFGGDLVAPGTNGDLADFTVTGTPEVDVNVSYVAELELSNWIAKGAEYCPIVFTVNGTSYSMDGGYANIDAFEEAVETAIENSAKNYNAGTNLGEATNVANDLAVSWAWYFEGANEGGQGPAMQWNEYDTDLGNWILKGVEAGSISLEVSCTVTQID